MLRSKMTVELIADVTTHLSPTTTLADVAHRTTKEVAVVMTMVAAITNAALDLQSMT